MNDLIYGKDETQAIVSIDSNVEGITLTFADGTRETRPASYWLLYTKQHSEKFTRLDGNLPYKYIMEYDCLNKYESIIKHSYKNRYQFLKAKSPVESCMIRQGLTLYKGMKTSDVSVLSFDIETDGLVQHKDSKVYLISVTFRENGRIRKKLFSLDEYKSQVVMIEQFCRWVRLRNPNIIVGHNVLGYDLPYLDHVARINGMSGLALSDEGSLATFNERKSKFRRDASQYYEYNDCHIFGRQIVDTFFLAIKHDVARKYPSYGLKQIVQFEGLEKAGRQHYDAGSIRDNWDNEKEREKIKQYAVDDADDSLALFDLMISPFFYLAQSVPKTLQEIVNSASGSQVNSIMVRSYLQHGHSIPMPTEAAEYEGGISYGNPGIYRNCYKVDVASLYPSIILQYGICDTSKDPKKNFLKIVEYFTKERLENKAKAKETKERYYKDLEQSQKIVINSMYGFLGTKGLAFNAPDLAAEVTRKGREILTKGIDWAKAKGYEITNVDTDSFMYTGPKHTKKSFAEEIDELNTNFDSGIRWEDDGTYKRVLIVRAKNYCLDDGKEITIKGSALKATMKEPALKRFIDEVTGVLLAGNKDHVFSIYQRYASEIASITDITDWCSKKTITNKLKSSDRTNETRIMDAIEGTDVSDGDKVYVFFEDKETVTLRENFNGTYCRETLYRKLYKTLEVFGSVIDISVFPNYALKKNETLLAS